MIDRQILEMAERVSARLKVVKEIVAIAIGGSSSVGTNDERSDIDIALYYHKDNKPSIERLNAIVQELDDDHLPDRLTDYGAWGRFWNGGGGITVDQIKVDFSYRSIEFDRSTIEECIAGRIYSEYVVGAPNNIFSPSVLGCTHNNYMIYDPENKVAQLKALVANYPPLLKQTIINKFYWEATIALSRAKTPAARGDIYFTVGEIFRCMTSLLQILFALNEKYYMTEKRVLSIISSFKIIPENFVSQATQILAMPGETPEQLTNTVFKVKDLIDGIGRLCDKPLVDFKELAQPGAISRLKPKDNSQEPELIVPTNIVKVEKVQEAKIVISGTFTAEPLEPSLKLWLNQLAIPAKIEFAPYSQVFQEQLDPKSLSSLNEKGVNIIFLRFEDWRQTKDEYTSPLTLPNSYENIIQSVRDFLAVLKASAAHRRVPQIVCLCPANTEAEESYEEMTALVVAELAEVKGIYVITSSELMASYPVSDYYDAYGDKQGHIPYTPLMYTALSTMVMRKWQAINSLPYKVIVLDCDQTLWQGVCSEDGPMGIKIDSNYQALQEFMVNQYQQGMLLCLCSKNNEEDVQAVFNHRKDMVLKPEHIIAQRVNWSAKSSNIKSLAQQLKLGLDSFIFIDDNPVECAEVALECPEVLVLQLPPESKNIASFLSNVWAFDRIKVTAEDRQRTLLYKQNIARDLLKTEAVTLADFLTKLELQIKISLLEPEQLERVAQLTQRTNQFNLTTIRYSTSELAQLDREQKECLVVTVTDRFGDYGLVGVLIYGREKDNLKVDSFLLSCRVLGRGVEHQMVVKLGQIAQQKGLSSIELHYIPTKKNQPAQEFLTSLKLEAKEAGGNTISYRLSTSQALALTYQPQSIVVNADKPVIENSISGTTGANSVIINQIANKLSNPQEILAAIESQQVKTERTDLATYDEPRTELEKYLARKWEEMFGLNRISLKDNFFELGGDSIKAALFLNSLQNELGESVYIITLFDAPTLGDFANYLTKHYSKAVVKRFGIKALATEEKIIKIDQAKVTELRSLIKPLAPFSLQEPASKQPIIFILAPPRSGTTLLRVMLAGHHRLFSPPELQLLCFNTLAERRASFTGRKEFWLEGTIRALMELKDCDAETAKSLMESYEAANLNTAQFYHLMQAELGDKILVDKTPFYALDIETLKRAEQYFEQAYYIHLTRHPYGTIKSFEEARIDQVFWYENPFSTKELAEMTWLISHENILEFLKQVPQNRQHTISFEQLVSQPQAIMEKFCKFLHIEFEGEMVKPHQDKSQKMTDGLQGAPRMLGDLKFHTHKDINSQTADSWKAVYKEPFLADITKQLAETLGYRENQEPNLLFKPIKPKPADAKDQLSFAQERLWVLDQLSPFNNAYNTALRLRFVGELDIKILTRSLQTIIDHQANLRANFGKEQGKPKLYIHPQVVFKLKEIDLSGMDLAHRTTMSEELSSQEAQKAFNLANDLLIRGMLLKLGAQEHLLLLTLHHIITDGWSLGILFRSLKLLYEAYREGQSSPLKELPIQYVDYAHWQKELVNSENMALHVAYWQQYLGESLVVLELPLDYQRPKKQTYKGAKYANPVGKELLENLRQVSQKQGVSLFMTLMAVFKLVLYSYSGQEEILIGTPYANRHHVEIEDLIGFFVNILPLKTNITADITFVELVQRVKKGMLGAYQHQEIPLEKVLDKLKIRRDLTKMPLQAAFALQNAPRTKLTLTGLTIEFLTTNTDTAKLDLSCFAYERDGDLVIVWEYNTDLFKFETIQTINNRYNQLLQLIIKGSQNTIKELVSQIEVVL